MSHLLCNATPQAGEARTGRRGRKLWASPTPDTTQGEDWSGWLPAPSRYPLIELQATTVIW